MLPALERTIRERAVANDDRSYTRKLLDNPAFLAGKLREETEEVIEATEDSHVTWECADLIYHLMVRMRGSGIDLARVESELRSRFR